jgi:hypothetical protein
VQYEDVPGRQVLHHKALRDGEAGYRVAIACRVYQAAKRSELRRQVVEHEGQLLPGEQRTGLMYRKRDAQALSQSFDGLALVVAWRTAGCHTIDAVVAHQVRNNHFRRAMHYHQVLAELLQVLP